MVAKTVPVHPDTLRWAREEAGFNLTQAAEELKQPVERLHTWESGTQGVKLSDARKLADKYKVSLQLLYLREIPNEWRVEAPKDFRREESRRPYGYRLRMALRDAHTRQSWMRQYLIEEGEKQLAWLSSRDEKEGSTMIANWIIDWLKVDRDAVERLPDDKEALTYWIEKLESKGVVVTSNNTHNAYKVDREEYSGLVLYDDYAPLILLNPADSAARRIFTLIHELAHLLLDKSSGISRIDFRVDDAGYDPLEVLCNQIAANVLIDESVFESVWKTEDNVRQVISELSKRMKVSHSAIAVKLRANKLINQDELNHLLGDYKKRYVEAEKNRTRFGRTVPDKQAIDRCGKLLVQSVLMAYDQGSINAIEIHDILRVKLKYLHQLSARVGFPLHRWGYEK